MKEADASIEIRCFCRHHPLLGVCGRDSATGKPFVHVRVMKNKEVHADVVVTSGVVRLFCRDCLRWQTITIRETNVDAHSEPLPESIAV